MGWAAIDHGVLHGRDIPRPEKEFQVSSGHKRRQQPSLPTELPESIKLVDCGGKPKPHQLNMLPYIKQNWHDVPSGTRWFDADFFEIISISENGTKA